MGMNIALESGWFPMVVLRHTYPGSAEPPHLDWLLARSLSANEGLISFRVLQRPDEVPPESPIAAIRMSDHRAMYLEYEGPISGNRGQVTRAASGLVQWRCLGENSMNCNVTWEGGMIGAYAMERIGPLDSSQYRIFRFPSATV